MNVDIFVQNVKILSFAKGETPTTACKNAGVGGSFISDLNRGRVPSVAKVQLLASYLGVTTSELLGEEKENPATVSSDGAKQNELRLAGRDGTYLVRHLSDEQLAAFKIMAEGLPEADDL